MLNRALVLLGLVISGCAREGSSGPELRPAGAIARAAQLSDIRLPPSARDTEGECFTIPSDVLPIPEYAVRHVAYLMPRRQDATRRVLIGLDAAGAVVVFNDIRMGEAPLEIDVDLRRGTGLVIGKPAKGNAWLASWRGGADAILGDSRLGNPGELIEVIRRSCLK